MTDKLVHSIARWFLSFQVLLNSDEMSAAGSTHLKRVSIQRSESLPALPLNYGSYVSMVHQLGHPPQPREMMVQLVVPCPPPRAWSGDHSKNAPCPAGSWSLAGISKMPLPRSHRILSSRPILPTGQNVQAAISSNFHLHSENHQQYQLTGRTASN